MPDGAAATLPRSAAGEPEGAGHPALVVWSSTLAAAAVFALLAPVLALLAPAAPDPAASGVLAPPGVLRPEPVESYLYTHGVLFLPVFALVWFALALPRLERAVAARPRRFRIGTAAAVSIIGAAAIAGDGFFYVSRTAYSVHPGWVAAGALAALAAAASRFRVVRAAARIGCVALPVFLLALTFAGGVFLRDDPYPRFPLGGHFEAMFFPVVQVWEGSPLLAESGNQYGLFAHFLVPIFRLVGLGVVRYSVLMSLLATGFVAALLAVAMRLVRDRWLAVSLWAAGVSLSLHCGQLHHRQYTAETLGPAYVFNDPYFQLNPLRTLFPGILLLLAFSRISAERRIAAAGFVAAGAGMLWNLETGFVSLAAWTAFVAHRRMAAAAGLPRKARAATGALGGAVAGAALVFAVFTAAYRIGYGRMPQWERFLEFQRVFYGSGFYMLPMPLPGTWMLVLLVCALALFYSIHALFRPPAADDRRPALALMLSVMGFGLFTYYQGRSHPDVLPGVSWPAWILAAMALEARRDVLRWAPLRAVLAFVLSAYVLTTVAVAPGIAEEWRDRIAYATEPGPHTTDSDYAFIRAQATQGRLLCLTSTASLCYLEADRAPAFAPSWPETMRRGDVDRLVALLDAPGIVIVTDRDSLHVLDRTDVPDHPLQRVLAERFKAVATSPSRFVVRLGPR